MRIIVTGRHFELSDEVKERATLEIEKLTKFFDNIVSAKLVLTQENYRFGGELSMGVYRSNLVAKASTEDPLATIEMVTDKMATQLKKHKGKLKDRKQKETSARKEDVDLSTSTDEVEF